MTTSKKYYTGAAIWVMIMVLWVSCNKVGAQTKSQIDSAAKIQQAADKFVDSLVSNTSLRSFQEWLLEIEGAKRYITFMEQYNAFVRTKYDLWLREKNKPKPR